MIPSLEETWDLEPFYIYYTPHNPVELKRFMNLDSYMIKLNNSGCLECVPFWYIRFKSESNEFYDFTINK